MRTRRRHASNYAKRMGGIAKIPKTERAAVRRAILSNRARLDAGSFLAEIEVETEETQRRSGSGKLETGPVDAARVRYRTAREIDVLARASVPCERITCNIAKQMSASEGELFLADTPLRILSADEQALVVGRSAKSLAGKSGESRARGSSADTEVAKALKCHVESWDIPKLRSILYFKTNFHAHFSDVNYFHARNLIAYVQKKVLELRRKFI